MKTLQNNKFSFLIILLFLFMSCKGQTEKTTTSGNNSIQKSIETMSEEEIKKICYEINKKVTQKRSDSVERAKQDSIRFKNFPNLTSHHIEYDRKNDSVVKFITAATPIIQDNGGLFLSPSNVSFSRFEKIKKISWTNKGDTITLSEIGHIYTIVNDMLLVIDTQENNLSFFTSDGKRLPKVLDAPMLKSQKMIHGAKSYDGTRYVIRPEGNPVEDNEGNVIDHKPRKGDIGVFSGDEIIINGVKYIRVWIYGGNNIEAQFLNLEELKWENQAMWIGII